MVYAVGPAVGHARSRRPQSYHQKPKHLRKTLADPAFRKQFGWLRPALRRRNRSQTTKTRRFASVLDSEPEGVFTDRVRGRFQVGKAVAQHYRRERWKRVRAGYLLVDQSSHIRRDWHSRCVHRASSAGYLTLMVFQALTTTSTRSRMTRTSSFAHIRR